jgi:mRNA interferase MazF
MAILPHPGDVVIVPHQGIQQSKVRPFVVVSSDVYHATRPDIVLGLLTSQLPATRGPTDYILQDWQAAGLRFPTLFRSFFMTVPVVAVQPPIGQLSARDWAEVQARLRVALAV